MKKAMIGILLFIVGFTSLNASVALGAPSFTENGLLYGQPVTHHDNHGPVTTNALTDNEYSTSVAVTKQYSEYVSYTFSTPHLITAFQVSHNYQIDFKFYDSTGNLIHMERVIESNKKVVFETALTDVLKIEVHPVINMKFMDIDVFGHEMGSEESPSNLEATVEGMQVYLSWGLVNGALGYNVKRSTNSGGPYTTIATNVTEATYTDTTVTAGITYFYVVSAVLTEGEGGNSNEVSATLDEPVSPATTRALLSIIMENGLEKEYDLSMGEVEDFIEWYELKNVGTGSALYAFDKQYNIGPFISRKEYVVFSHILLFNVDEYAVPNQ